MTNIIPQANEYSMKTLGRIFTVIILARTIESTKKFIESRVNLAPLACSTDAPLEDPYGQAHQVFFPLVYI